MKNFFDFTLRKGGEIYVRLSQTFARPTAPLNFCLHGDSVDIYDCSKNFSDSLKVFFLFSENGKLFFLRLGFNRNRKCLGNSKALYTSAPSLLNGSLSMVLDGKSFEIQFHILFSGGEKFPMHYLQL